MSLDTEPLLFRSAITRAGKPEVEEGAGNYKAGIIRNFSVITVGEALGHGMWIDQEFVESVGAQLALSTKGVKGRFTHPNQSGDSLSKQLGRATFSMVDGDKVAADFHFFKAAHNTPDGDLAGYLMELAVDDPEAFGASIAFTHDSEAMEVFAEENPQSPDLANVDNLPHVRLKKLRFVDMVDEPAANPDGLFHQDEVFNDAEKLMEYALGLTDTKPEGTLFGVDADRLHGFTTRFLSTRKIDMKLNLEKAGVESTEELSLVDTVEVVEAPVVEPVAEVVEETPEVEPVVEPVAEVVVEAKEGKENGDGVTEPTNTKGAFKAELDKYITTFGSELGIKYFSNDVSFADAMVEFVGKQQEEISNLKAKLEVEEQSSNQSFSFSSTDKIGKSTGGGMASKINLPE